MEFHEVFQYIGEMGLYQALLYTLLGIIYMMVSTQANGINFFAAPMPHWCQVSRLQNYSYETQKHVAIPYEEGGGGDELQYDSCVMFDLDYDSLTEEQILNWDRNDTIGVHKIDCSMGWVYDQSEFESTIISKYDLVCDKDWLPALTSTIFMLGFLVGSLGSGFLSDRFGRKYTTIVCAVIVFILTFCQTFAPNYTVYAILRFLYAAAAITTNLSAFVLVMEVIGPKYNVFYAILTSAFYSAGIMLVSSASYAIRDVEKLFIATSIPYACTILFLWTIPESPRWQVTQGRYREAEKTLKYIAKVNRRSFPDDVTWTVKEEVDKPKGRWADLCRSPLLCKELAIIYLNWFTASLVYYGVTFMAGSFGSVFLTTFVYGLVEIPANLIGWVFFEFYGRRYVNAISFILTGVFSLAVVPIILLSPESEGALTALSALGRAAISFAFSSIYVYTAELFPTQVRNFAVGSSSMMGRFGSMASPFLGQTLEQIWQPMPSVIFGSLAIFTGCISFLLPETKGFPVPDSVDEAENIARRVKPRDTRTPVDSTETIEEYYKF